MAEDLQLSCGTSLSEQAHGTLLPPSSSSSSSSSSVPQEEKTEPSSSAFKNNKSIQTIDDLRAHIAQDALTQNSSNHNNNHSSKAPLTTFASPFELPGQQHQPITLPIVYCDQAASNQPLQSIEKYLQDKCWPLYGNTKKRTKSNRRTQTDP
jgi:hypothetical protein